MLRNLVLASAGSGKTERIVSDAIERYRQGQTVLIITYTENNQTELEQRISTVLGAVPNQIRIKGWFTFLLEDLIRPYQQVFFETRIENINFNASNPHKIPRRKFTIKGRQEHTNGQLNHKHYLTTSKTRIHTAFISKLACRISDADEASTQRKIGRKRIKDGFSFKRLEVIYDAIFFDEVQDLTGWDYQILQKLSVTTKLDLLCVGDFRQTIYLTHHDRKLPSSNAEKMDAFCKLNFKSEPQFISHRCIQLICDFSDTIHTSLKLPKTQSKVKAVPDEYSSHLGIFAVTEKYVEAYFEEYSPMILRNQRNIAVDLCADKDALNFGESKGLGFNRVLIIPTTRQKHFLCRNNNAFDGLKTDQEINRFYVAVTRARYSVAILLNETPKHPNVTVWCPSN